MSAPSRQMASDYGPHGVRVNTIIVSYHCHVSESSAVVQRSEISVNAQGRVTIPAQIRREAGLEVGAPLVVYVEDGRVVIETREQLSARLRRDVAAAWTGHPGVSVADELIADRRAEAATEDGQPGGRA